MKAKLHPYIFGAIGLLGMIVFYGGLLWATTADALHPLYFFAEKWYFLTPLFLGFGIQMLLFQKLRITIHKNKLAMAGASTGVNGVAMAACCAHHLADFFPVVGLAGAATAVTEYQDWFLGLGVLINIIGIWYMWSRLRKQMRMPCAATAIPSTQQ